MSRVVDVIKDVLQTAFRLMPWPTETGLRTVGSPDRDSPVLVTANYDFTVRHLLRALRGIDAWVLVAPAKGINVWCAAAGGHFTTHQVVTALKTSGISEKVDHRNLILPQLAATGVEGLGIHRRTGWRVRFGPVRAQDLPAYLAAGGEKTDAMRQVTFSLRERLEMAATWAAPTALVVGGAAAVLRPAWAWPLIALACTLAATVFLAYERISEPRRWLLGFNASAISFAVVASAGGGVAAMVAAVISTAALTALLTYDYAGSTPHEGGSHFDGQDWKIQLDVDRCAGIFRCWEVCPEACFEKLEDQKKVELAHDDRCVRCGACVVQCPQDALYFEDGTGQRIEPDTIRRFKLNLMGQRTVSVAPSAPAEEARDS